MSCLWYSHKVIPDVGQIDYVCSKSTQAKLKQALYREKPSTVKGMRQRPKVPH